MEFASGVGKDFELEFSNVVHDSIVSSLRACPCCDHLGDRKIQGIEFISIDDQIPSSMSHLCGVCTVESVQSSSRWLFLQDRLLSKL